MVFGNPTISVETLAKELPARVPHHIKEELKTHMEIGNCWRISIVGCAILVLLGCKRNQELTRSTANELIAQSARFSPVVPTLELTSAELQCGLKEGLWIKTGRNRNLLDSMFAFHLEVTEKGKAGFNKLSPSYSERYAASVTLSKQYAREVVDVTGIADYSPPLEGWTGKEVQFTWRWNWDQFNDLAKKCLTPRSDEKGRAVFRHYDDGWRVEQIRGD